MFIVNIENFKNPKIWYIFEETLLSIICSECGSKDKKMSGEEESNEILKILPLINIIEEYQKIWLNKSRIYIKEINKTRNYFIEEIKQNELINRKHKKVCKINNTEHLLILSSTEVFL